jgi:hypothetical protein
MQALAEGDLSERARQRAMELANDADIRLSPTAAHLPPDRLPPERFFPRISSHVGHRLSLQLRWPQRDDSRAAIKDALRGTDTLDEIQNGTIDVLEVKARRALQHDRHTGPWLIYRGLARDFL